MDIDPFNSRLLRSNTYWWITSLAISVVCCSVLFVWFSSYVNETRQDLAVNRVRIEVLESRVKEMSADVQILNRRSTVQQIQIIPSGNPQGAPGTINAEPASPAASPAPPPAPATPPAKP